MKGVWLNPLNQADKYYDVTVSLRNTEALSAYSLEGKQIIEAFFPKGLDKW